MGSPALTQPVRLLLDTHVWLWQALAPDRVSRRAARALADPDHDLYLSPVTSWEALALAQRGRVDLGPDPEAWVRAALARSPTTMAPLTHEIAITSRALPSFDNPDPADRFLLATCVVQGLVLVTADRPMRRCRLVQTLW